MREISDTEIVEVADAVVVVVVVVAIVASAFVLVYVARVGRRRGAGGRR